MYYGEKKEKEKKKKRKKQSVVDIGVKACESVHVSWLRMPFDVTWSIIENKII